VLLRKDKKSKIYEIKKAIKIILKLWEILKTIYSIRG